MKQMMPFSFHSVWKIFSKSAKEVKQISSQVCNLSIHKRKSVIALAHFKLFAKVREVLNQSGSTAAKRWYRAESRLLHKCTQDLWTCYYINHYQRHLLNAIENNCLDATVLLRMLRLNSRIRNIQVISFGLFEINYQNL